MTRPQREGRVRDVVARRPEDERDAVVAFRSSQLRVESRQGRYLRESSLCYHNCRDGRIDGIYATVIKCRRIDGVDDVQATSTPSPRRSQRRGKATSRTPRKRTGARKIQASCESARARSRRHLSSIWSVACAAATCVEISMLRRLRAESSRCPPRHLHDTCSTALRCRFLTARRGQHPTHSLISTQHPTFPVAF